MGTYRGHGTQARDANAPEANATQARRKGSTDVPRRSDGHGFMELLNGQLKQVLHDGVSQRVGKPADDLAGLAKALRFSAKQLEGNFSAPYVDKLAEQLERAAKLIGKSDARQVLASLERYARREPLLFLGGALLVGIGGARFLKSSASSSNSTNQSQS